MTRPLMPAVAGTAVATAVLALLSAGTLTTLGVLSAAEMVGSGQGWPDRVHRARALQAPEPVVVVVRSAPGADTASARPARDRASTLRHARAGSAGPQQPSRAAQPARPAVVSAPDSAPARDVTPVDAPAPEPAPPAAPAAVEVIPVVAAAPEPAPVPSDLPVEVVLTAAVPTTPEIEQPVDTDEDKTLHVRKIDDREP